MIVRIRLTGSMARMARPAERMIFFLAVLMPGTLIAAAAIAMVFIAVAMFRDGLVFPAAVPLLAGLLLAFISFRVFRDSAGRRK